MKLHLSDDPLPLKMDDHGVVRVSGTRVTLDTLVGAFLDGATPEGIALAYSSLPLADIYSVLGYYLRRRAEVDAYLKEEEREAEAIRTLIESKSDVRLIRERLLARRKF